MKHSGRETWDDLARELMEIHPPPGFFFIQTRETPLVPGITGDGKMVKTTLSLGFLRSSGSSMKHKLPHTGYHVVKE